MLAVRAARRILEGRHAWGELEVWSSHYGYTCSCLVIYPPESTRGDRIRLRMMRAWPPLGLLLGILVVVVIGQSLPLVPAIAIGGAVYAAGALAAARIAGPGRRRMRTLQTCRGDAGTGGLDRGPQDLLDALAEQLLENERLLRDGAIDPVEYEAVLGRAWDELDALERQRS